MSVLAVTVQKTAGTTAGDGHRNWVATITVGPRWGKDVRVPGIRTDLLGTHRGGDRVQRDMLPIIQWWERHRS